jgi:hypothetical protein
MEQNILQPELRKTNKRPTLIIGGIIVTLLFLLGLGSAYFFWYLPKDQAKEYLESSQPLFDTIEKKVMSAKENTFLDANTQYHRREDAKDDNLLDIEELEGVLGDIESVRKDLSDLKRPKIVLELDRELHVYLDKAEQVLKLHLEEQKLYQKVIDAYGDDLDREINQYTEMSYTGGNRTQFILQTQRVVDFAEDALSRINNIKTPQEGEDVFTYKIRKENVEDIKETFTKLNEYYRLFQFDRVDAEIQGITERNNAMNERVKEHGKDYITNSDVAQGFQSLEDQAQDLRNIYQEIRKEL